MHNAKKITFNIIGSIIGSIILYNITNEGGLIIAYAICSFICFIGNAKMSYGCIGVWIFCFIYTLISYLTTVNQSGFLLSDLIIYIVSQLYSAFICFAALFLSSEHR